MTNKNKLIGLLIAFAAAAPFGCGDDNGTSDIDTKTPDAGGKDSGIAIKDGGGAEDDKDSATGTDEDGSVEGTDAGTDADGSVTGCVSVDGCFCGTPTKMTDFLNACTDATTVTKVPVIPLANADGTVKPL